MGQELSKHNNLYSAKRNSAKVSPNTINITNITNKNIILLQNLNNSAKKKKTSLLEYENIKAGDSRINSTPEDKHRKRSLPLNSINIREQYFAKITKNKEINAVEDKLFKQKLDEAKRNAIFSSANGSVHTTELMSCSDNESLSESFFSEIRKPVGTGRKRSQQLLHRINIKQNMGNTNNLDSSSFIGRGSLNYDFIDDDIFSSSKHYFVRRNTISTVTSTYNEEEDCLITDNSFNNIDFDYKALNSDYLRNSYLSKLLYKQIWTPSHKRKSHNCVFIFDWNDTLLCTSFLSPKGYFDESIVLSDYQLQIMAKNEFSVLRIIHFAINNGDTYIISNSPFDWVNYSIKRFYPSLLKYLNKIRILSAKDLYGNTFPNDSKKQKNEVFQSISKEYNKDLVMNLVCFGDSIAEMEAAYEISKGFTHMIPTFFL